MKHNFGFSLLEITIVLLIIGLILGGLLNPLSVSIERKNRNDLKRELNIIKNSLLGYVVVHKRLPCPDTDDDDYLENDCSTTPPSSRYVVGGLPWATLGVKGLDPWGSQFIYAVDKDFADSLSADEKVSFTMDTTAILNIKDDGCDSSPNDIAQDVPVVVISQGKESDRQSCHETENSDGDNDFVYKNHSDGDEPYDDLIIWISPYELINHMVKAEILP